MGESVAIPARQPWAIQPAPYGGLRLVATAPVREGQTVLDERPFVYCDLPCGDGLDPAEVLTLTLLADPRLLSQYRQMRLATNSGFAYFADAGTVNDLHRRSGRTKSLSKSVYISVLTNTSGCLSANGQLVGFGIYPTIARSDHSCEPNAVLAPSLGRNRMALLTTRDVEAGEPITWNYRPESLDFLERGVEDRNMELVDHLRFACQCTRCQRERDPSIPASGLLSRYHDLLMAQVALAAREAKQLAGSTMPPKFHESPKLRR